MTRFVFVGTSHVSPESVRKVERAIETEKPDAVAIELDPLRYELMTRPPEKSSTLALIRTNGIMNFLLMRLLSGIQAGLGKKTGADAGSEMLKAAEAARRRGIRVALIDMDARDIIRLMGKISLAERLRLVALLSGGMGGMLHRQWNARNVPSDRLVAQALRALRKNFPRLYEVLVVEREDFMARFLLSMRGKYRKVVVVVGAGHVRGLKKRLGGRRL